MAIHILNQNTINQIAAGEVVDRPSSVVKELVENAIDAGSTAITVEIKEGGISFIRITDNGSGIAKEDIPIAFLRHSTSKIKDAADLVSISSLGFRGEALSSISAVAQVELITKTRDSLSGIRYEIEGGVEKTMEEVGAPDGTTFIVRNLFYNTPARRKFLKTAATEGGYINSLMEHLCMSHPDISFRFIQNNQPKLQTSGNGNLKDVIYAIYGREITGQLVEIEGTYENFSVKGYVAKPVVARSNRNFENYYINGRYIKSAIIMKAIESAYAPFMMQHKYPFTAFHITIEPDQLDVNVHPSKMELRFSNGQYIYDSIVDSITQALTRRELIPEVVIEDKPKRVINPNIQPVKQPQPRPVAASPKPTEQLKATEIPKSVQLTLKESGIPYSAPKSETPQPVHEPVSPVKEAVKPAPVRAPEPFEVNRIANLATKEEPEKKTAKYEQLQLIDEPKLLEKEHKKDIKIIGQVFDTYWIIQFEQNMYIIDQHAAHEKVLYEKFMKRYEERNISTQYLSPPVIISLTGEEEIVLKENMQYFESFGFEIEEFGGDSYAIRGIPADFTESNHHELLLEILDSMTEDSFKKTPESIKDRIATMSCKAAVKGNNRLSSQEATELINNLMNLENPYNCPHGRPTMISMSKYELEKKFKRII